MRVCVIGAAGQLGGALVRAFRAGHEVIEGARQPRAAQARIDLTDVDALGAALDRARPEVVLLAGAYCHVDGAETARALVTATNVTGPRAVATWARAHGARVVYYSTDHVFDGAAQAAYTEGDTPRPLNAYAVSKLEGERAVAETLPDGHLIVRTAWLYGPDAARRNFALRLVDRIRAGERVRVPSDQWGTPTHTDDVAAVTRALVEGGHTGIFHVVGPELVARVDLAHRVCAAFALDPTAVVPVPTRELGQAAPRPLRVQLDVDRLRRTGAPRLRSLADGLAALRAGESAPVAGATR